LQQILGKPARDLLKILAVTEDPGCKAIDEISLLDKFDTNLLIAFRRALCLLNTLPIWTFLLDTSSGHAILVPAA
jgi:hypothetical protein